MLTVRNLTKSFPGVRALDGVDFELRPGEIHALMGENGAGKSTLIKVLTGVHQAESGAIDLEGSPIRPRSVAEAQNLGISTVYQEVNLVPTLSVEDNIVLGRHPVKFGRIDRSGVSSRSKAALARLGVEIDVRRTLGSFSIAIQQLVAIARALDFDSKVLILDEPTSSLDRDEVKALFGVLRELKRSGLGIVFVSHFLDQVYELSDRITVLRNGKVVGVHETPTLPRLRLVSQMLGRSETAICEPPSRSRESELAEVVVEARGLGKRGTLEPIDLSARKGEVLGFAGLLGSGRTEAAHLLFGAQKPDQGTVVVDKVPRRFDRPSSAIKAGLGLVPEDRKAQSIFPALTVRENIALGLQVRKGWLRRVSRAAQSELADRYISALGIVTPSAEAQVGTLSGGNQQKVVIARWLASQPKVLILDEPTRGIDVGAKAEIEKLIGEQCGAGVAIILIATDLEEVVRDSHRVVVMRDRKKVGELAGDEIGVEPLMKLIAGDST